MMLSLSNERAAEQFIGREAETAILLSRCLLTLSLRVAVSAHVNSSVRNAALSLMSMMVRFPAMVKKKNFTVGLNSIWK